MTNRNTDFTAKWTGDKERELYTLYCHWKDAQRGTDRDFIATIAGLAESTFRKKVRKWRDNVQALKDPISGIITGAPTVGTPANQENAPSAPASNPKAKTPSTNTQARHGLQGAEGLSLKETPEEAAKRFAGMSASEQEEEARVLLEGSTALAAATLQELMLTATPSIREKIATGILKSKGLNKEGSRVKDRSEYETWPRKALVELLGELGVTVLPDRAEPNH